MNLMNINGYSAKIEYDADLDLFRGEILGLTGGADFYGKNPRELRSEFKKSLEVFLEVRHKDWYLPENQKLLGDFLQANNSGAVITDTSGRRDMLHMELTVPKALIRFVGNNMNKRNFRIHAFSHFITFFCDCTCRNSIVKGN